MENLKNAWNDASINIPKGLLNSFFVAGCTAILTTYFSALTAYGIHAYDFKLKKAAFTFIMAIMVIPSQVSAAGFVQLCYKFHLTNKFWPLILPGIAAPVVFFYMKQYLESVLPLEMVEAARVDGASTLKMFFKITLPYVIFVTTPYLISSFVGNINSFNTIYLLTGGGPTYTGYQAGGTDLLVTWLYKVTIDQGSYNTGAVIGIFTFLITATITLITYRRSRAYNEEDTFQ